MASIDHSKPSPLSSSDNSKAQGRKFHSTSTLLKPRIPTFSKHKRLDMSDKAQPGLATAADFVSVQMVQNVKDAAKSFSAYQHIVNATEPLAKCKDIIASEEGSAIEPEKRKNFVESLIQLEMRRKELEQEYSSLFNCVFKHSDGQMFSADSSDLHETLLYASVNGLA